MYNFLNTAELTKLGYGKYTSPIFGNIDISDGVFYAENVSLCVYIEDMPEEDMIPLVEHHHEIAKTMLQLLDMKGVTYNNPQFTIISDEVLQADFYCIAPSGDIIFSRGSDAAMRIYFNNANKLATVCISTEIPYEYRRTWRMPITKVNPADLLCAFMGELAGLYQTHESIVEAVSKAEETIGDKLDVCISAHAIWRAVKTCEKEAKAIIELSLGLNEFSQTMVVAMSEINNLQVESIIEAFYSDEC